MTAAHVEIAALLRGKSVIVDSELLILYCVGLSDPSVIETTAATKAFVASDFHALDLMLRGAKAIHVTQSALVEASNHLDRKERSRLELLSRLRDLVCVWTDSPVLSADVTGSAHFLSLGFTDCALSRLASATAVTVLTKDRKLAGVLRSAGLGVVNFNDVRHLWWSPATF